MVYGKTTSSECFEHLQDLKTAIRLILLPTLLILVRDSNAKKFQVSKTWATLFCPYDDPVIKYLRNHYDYRIIDTLFGEQVCTNGCLAQFKQSSKNHVSFSSSECYDSFDFFTEIKNDANQKSKRFFISTQTIFIL